MPFTGWSSEVTPRDIAVALGISEKSLRAWLRKNPQVIHAHNERWVFTPDEAELIVDAYRAKRGQTAVASGTWNSFSRRLKSRDFSS